MLFLRLCTGAVNVMIRWSQRWGGSLRGGCHETNVPRNMANSTLKLTMLQAAGKKIIKETALLSKNVMLLLDYVNIQFSCFLEPSLHTSYTVRGKRSNRLFPLRHSCKIGFYFQWDHTVERQGSLLYTKEHVI